MYNARSPISETSLRNRRKNGGNISKLTRRGRLPARPVQLSPWTSPKKLRFCEPFDCGFRFRIQLLEWDSRNTAVQRGKSGGTTGRRRYGTRGGGVTHKYRQAPGKVPESPPESPPPLETERNCRKYAGIQFLPWQARQQAVYEHQVVIRREIPKSCWVSTPESEYKRGPEQPKGICDRR